MRRKEAKLSTVVPKFVDAAVPTLKELAEESGVSYAAVRSWVKDGRVPRDATLDSFIRAVEARHAHVADLIQQIRRAQQGRR